MQGRFYETHCILTTLQRGIKRKKAVINLDLKMKCGGGTKAQL